MELDADLHLHGRYSGGVSDRMVVPEIADQAEIKGLDLVGTGDILHPKWRQHVREQVEDEGNGLYRFQNTHFLLTTEIEDAHRVHHLVFFPSWAQVEALADDVQEFSPDLEWEGRPRVELAGEEIAKLCVRHDLVWGPAHAFTPWTAIYKEYDSLKDCYGSYRDQINFLELGLSADSALADNIKDLHSLVFLSNSDAHSPWPHRLGREFNRFKLAKLDFSHIKKALGRKGNNQVMLNVGLDPRQGKYHCTACTECYTHVSLAEAENYSWVCSKCGGSIKKGVKDRINQLSDTKKAPAWRPEYIHLPPLASLIQTVVGHSSPTTNRVQQLWAEYLADYAGEIEVLLEAPVSELTAINDRVGKAIELFRQDQVDIEPGGGGRYGRLSFPHLEDDQKQEGQAQSQHYTANSDQTSLSDFSS